MKTYWGYLNQMAQNVEQDFAKFADQINWYNPYKSAGLDERKLELLQNIERYVNWSFAQTKPFVNRLSRGCQLCGEGEWSCLFITGKCNANCFYCPADQSTDSTPQTQKLLFEKPEFYVNYINKFKFKGVSFSGGEPLLVFDRTLEFLKQVRQHCSPDIYIWMYTNGILATDEKLKALGEAGLNEIRFDLGAVNYNPKVLKNAAKFIENVSVEIPAVPHEKQQLFDVLPLLCEYGVSILNLHQLRLTKYNASKLLQHEYTFQHGEQPTAIESEITAYEVMEFVAENNLPIGVNYCNFQFKNRFQKAGFRKKMAEVLKNENEGVTANGYLRKIVVLKGERLGAIDLDMLCAHPNACHEIEITYTGRVIENLSDKPSGMICGLGDQDYNIDEGLVTHPLIFKGDEIAGYLSLMKSSGQEIPNDPLLFEAWKFEFIEHGLREYF